MHLNLKKYIKKIIKKCSHFFINGFLTLLPITLTYSVFAFSFKIIKNLVEPLTLLQNKIPYLRDIPHAEIIVALVLIIIAGLFLRSFIIQSLFSLFETQLNRIPLIRPVYNGTKQLVNAFSPKKDDGFQKVVLVEFPAKGSFTIGFQTSAVPTNLAPGQDPEYLGVFVPTSPNPTSGFFIMVKKEQIQTLDITPQEAMALIISGGIVYPQKNETNSL